MFGTFFILFQFHKGTIRTSLRGIHQAVGTHFNSIKVQLELTNLEEIRL